MRGRRLVAAATLAVALLAPMGSAVAAEGSGEKKPPVTMPDQQNEPHTPGVVSPATLPFTGSDVTGFVIAGAMAMGAGAMLVRRTRVHKAQQ